MLLVVKGLDGIRHHAVVLAVGENRIRVAIEGCPDTVEIRRAYGQWSIDLGASVQLEGIIVPEDLDLARFCADLFPPERAVDAIPVVQTQWCD